MLNRDYSVVIHRLYQKMSDCNFELPNGARCNWAFYNLAVAMGFIIDEKWLVVPVDEWITF